METKNYSIGDGVSVCRRPLSLNELGAKLETRNARLKVLGEPELQLVEAMAARLYTGPAFAKYNAVLRGLDSTAPILRN
ncbi:MAG: hypothetical protein ACPIA5_05100, partial [Flavobacteriales bacterium]